MFQTGKSRFDRDIFPEQVESGAGRTFPMIPTTTVLMYKQMSPNTLWMKWKHMGA